MPLPTSLPRVTLSPDQQASFARRAPAALNHEVQQGQRILGGLGDTGKAVGALGRGALNLGDKFLGGASQIGKPLFNAGMGIADKLINTTGGRRLMGASVVAAPILASHYHNRVEPAQDEMMNIRQNPERVVTAASLETFMAKIANAPGMGTPAPQFGSMGGEFAKGVGNAVGKTLVETAVSTIAAGASALTDFLRNDGARKKMVQDMMHTDPVLADAVRADPKASQHIIEAYATLQRFAPALSLDPNAVRSFLREAVMSGGAVNYGTIKTLADTQKSIVPVR